MDSFSPRPLASTSSATSIPVLRASRANVLCPEQWNHEASKETTQDASQSVSPLISAADEYGYLAAGLTRVVVVVHVTTGVAAFSLHNSSVVSMTNDDDGSARALL